MSENQHIGQLTNRSKIVSNKKMTFMERIYFPAILKGLSITFSHLFKKKVTTQYPEVKRPMAEIYRGLHVLKRDEEGREIAGVPALALRGERPQGGRRADARQRPGDPPRAGVGAKIF